MVDEIDPGPILCINCNVPLDYEGGERYDCPKCGYTISFRDGPGLFERIFYIKGPHLLLPEEPVDIYGCIGRVVVAIIMIQIMVEVVRIVIMMLVESLLH